MSLKSLMACERKQVGATPRDGLIGAAVMLVASLIFKAVAAAAKRDFPITSDVLMNLAFLGPFTLSMPFWLMKGQSWKGQAVIVGGTLAVLVLIGYSQAR